MDTGLRGSECRDNNMLASKTCGNESRNVMKQTLYLETLKLILQKKSACEGDKAETRKA